MTSALPVSGGYIVDAGALGLLGSGGDELSRHVLSSFITRAITGEGPPLRIPALCLLSAAVTTNRLAEHVAQLVLAAPDDAIEVDELGMITVTQMVQVATANAAAGWDTWHAAYETAAHQGWTLITTQPAAYLAWPELTVHGLD